MVAIYVLDVPEFRALVEEARRRGGDCRVRDLPGGYIKIEHPVELVFERRQLGVKPAVWYGLLTGGLDGYIAEFGRDVLRIVGRNHVL